MRKVVKAALFVLALFFIGMNANAQYASSSSYSSNAADGGWRTGLKAGINFAGFNGKGADGLGGRVGTHVGFFAEYVLPSSLFVQTGLELSLKGAKISEKDEDEKLTVTYNPLYLQVPIHLGYQIGLTDDISLNVHAGPYLAFGILGKEKYTYEYDGEKESESDDFFGSEEDGGASRFDLGLGFGVDLDFSNTRIGLGYDAGLTNMSRDSNYPVKNRNFYISLAYKF